MAALNSSGCSGGNGSHGASISQTGSKWEQALQRLSKKDRERFDIVNKSLDDPPKVLDDVLTAVNKRKEECLKKRWRLVVIKGRAIYIRDILEKISVWVKKLVTIGDIAIQYDPVHAALPWAAVRLIMQTSINDLDTFGYVVVSLENLASIVAQCHIIETEYLGKRGPENPQLAGQLAGSVVNLYASVLQYLADILHYFNLSTGKRILKSIGQSQEDLQAKYLPIKSALEDFGRLAGFAQAAKLAHGLDLIESIDKQLKDRNAQDESEPKWLKPTIKEFLQPIDRIDNRLEAIEDDLREGDRAKILKAISNIPYGTHHKTASKGRVEDTGAWFFKKQEFKEWRIGSSSSVLWLHGIPGSGKTKLTSKIVDELLGHEHVAYFYCMRNPLEPQRAQCDRILGSLVRQLASVGPKQPILGPVVKWYEDAIDGAGEFEDQAWTTDECVTTLLQLFTEYPAVILVLDALDEVDQDSRQELLDALDRLIQQSTSLVRIFISSRSNYDIAASLVGAPNIYIEANDNAEDISTFIDKRLTEAKLLRGNLPPSLRTVIIDTLKDGAKGMFRWVDLQIESLRLLKVAADVRTRLGALPKSLEASYWEIYQQIMDSGDNALALATFTFQWLLYAKKPLPLEDFAMLASSTLGTDLDTKFTAVEVLDVCSNFIVEREGSFFEFAHLSVREFLEKFSSRQIDTYLPQEGHAALAQACLLYLKQAATLKWPKGEYRNSERKAEGGDTEESSEAETKDYLLSPPTQYAAAWMIDHVGAAGSLRLNPPLHNLLKAFVLQQPEETTLEATSTGTALSYTVASSFNLCRKHWVGLSSTLHRTAKKGPIWLACELEWLELVEYLYQHPYDSIDNTAPFLVPTVMPYQVVRLSPFWYAIWKERMELAHCIAASTGNRNRTCSKEGGFELLLHMAISQDNAELVKRLAKLYPGDDEAAIGAFTNAAFLGHHEAMRLIIEPPLTSIEQIVRAQNGPDPLAIACANGSVETAKALIDNTVTIASGGCLLYLAVSAGHVEVVRLLLERHIGLGGTSTALNIAIAKGDVETANLLIQYGGKKDKVAVPKAVCFKKTQVVLRLIAAGYEVNGIYSSYSTVLHHAFRPTALHEAVISGQCEVVEALLVNQADINALNSFRQTTLHSAVKGGCKHCIEKLIDGGADIVARDRFEQTALDLASTEHRALIRRGLQDQIIKSCRDLFIETPTCSHDSSE